MSGKIFNTRVKNKRDSVSNWTDKNPILLDGEVVVVDSTDGESRFKIGDGTKHYSELPFQDEYLQNEINNKVYYDEATGVCSTKDSVSPIATTSTAGTIKVGNGLSISDDGTLSVTTATYYTGTADPVNTLGADGDLYLKTEG